MGILVMLLSALVVHVIALPRPTADTTAATAATAAAATIAAASYERDQASTPSVELVSSSKLGCATSHELSGAWEGMNELNDAAMQATAIDARGAAHGQTSVEAEVHIR